VSSGSYTFANAILSSLTTLDLSQTVFASNDISQPADVSIGDHTFFQVD
jgi:hypothetical protein